MGAGHPNSFENLSLKHYFGTWAIDIQCPAMPQSRCMTLDKAFDLSVLLICPSVKGINHTSSLSFRAHFLSFSVASSLDLGRISN